MYPTPTSLFYTFNFYLFGLIAIASALVFVTRKSPVSAALWLVATMCALAALYVMLDAPFIGVIQVLVYAGAIMVVFIFVVMLLNLGRESLGSDMRGLAGRLGGGAVGLALIAFLWAAHKGARQFHSTPAKPSHSSRASGTFHAAARSWWSVAIAAPWR